ncbi:MAG: CinA family nicotinamide mononucleotide deamidase-related protein [Thermoanaerobaculum sp.]|nr:CinA family nicotinamide mononucleotide deamidase-related protein [Thermoanaerobaculum sp.]
MGHFFRAAFVAVGSELLRTPRLDTNSLRVGEKLAGRGVVLVEKRCVPDEVEAIARAVEELLARADLVLLSGGLGPTADDVTREGVAQALGRKLTLDEGILGQLEDRYRRLGRSMPSIARRMAYVLEGADVLANPRGTAPGLWLSLGSQAVVLLPGVPEELDTILTLHVLPRVTGRPFLVRTLRVAGRFESEVEQRVAPLYPRFGREKITILASRGTVDLVLGAETPEELAQMDQAFSEVLQDDLFGRDEATLAQVVLEALKERRWLLATAESCTGGLVGSLLTQVPGASEAYLGGVVCYANSLKARLVGVPEDLLTTYGAVSRQVAEALALGACRLGAQCGLAITGIAGPGGGSAEKPVGTVHMAVATPHHVEHRLYRFGGCRQTVRELAANFALDLLRRTLKGAP